MSDLGDHLQAFAAAVDFEIFRAELELALAYSDGSRGGRPPFDPVMMFKVLVVQTINTLSDGRSARKSARGSSSKIGISAANFWTARTPAPSARKRHQGRAIEADQ